MNKTIDHNPLSTTKPAVNQQAFLFCPIFTPIFRGM